MHRIRFPLGSAPEPTCLQRSPGPLAGIKGSTSKGGARKALVVGRRGVQNTGKGGLEEKEEWQRREGSRKDGRAREKEPALSN